MTCREQRRSPRALFTTDIAVIDVESGVDFTGQALDASEGGLAFYAKMEPALGAEMEVIVPGMTPCRAVFTAARINRTDHGFFIAGPMTARAY